MNSARNGAGIGGLRTPREKPEKTTYFEKTFSAPAPTNYVNTNSQK